MTAERLPRLELRDGNTIPAIGYGLFQVPSDDAQRLIEEALAAGYRHIDGAAAYGNEGAVGKALAASGIDRDEIFVTTKLWNADQGYDSALRAFDSSRELLGLDEIDLYLIHFPAPERGLFAETWTAFERLHAEGGARSIGVSNFIEPYLQELLASANEVPAVHQIEVHPTYQQRALQELSRAHGMVVEAYSPLGRSADLSAPAVVEAAARHGRTPAQVIVRWHVQHGTVPLPKSVNPERIVANLAVDDFVLTEAEMGAIDALEAGNRTGEDIPHFN
ncbi:aldo/keto reductase [Demequina sp. NBRC 110054]|uniref:aldo/keto reductase n=1 Tax=Demequina sp. NBRC 110054 TaxID=1570343 RepID=UPI0009FCBA4B|nr:aldo/keto reductase [Demequina sp. NBRC 110054]